ncbi:hypothetical protein A1O1_02226 [Capronia coronata CBS 617.96]|uniref:Uncharacterized protein n=1 Tax=Capronia coronata CBS 617.96 TaxID=1182541 RepID=W9YMT4_9EURO|nr:uncharacterized protein A1O1_02226 [Capronia coronata CBS 617.96]EXJ93833.1 hypothetical protein A1O1_02226 [Capronia coronata CBS 617.96]
MSPRQRFQAHVRTLSTDSLSTSGSLASPQRSPELQHVSSLRVQPRDSPPAQYVSGPHTIYRLGDSSLSPTRSSQYEPPFIREEREAWSRASPGRTLRGRSQDMYILQPPEEDDAVIQPSKRTRRLKSLTPSTQALDDDEKPTTSRGHNGNLTDDLDHRQRNSRFAEGSMNERSAGVSSAWGKQGSITSVSGTESDNDSTPRASPQRSSVDLEEFKPAAVTPATLKQRLYKLGTAFKPHEHSTKQIEEEAQPAKKKKKGLRKSISMWNIHGIGGKMKTFGGSSNDLTPNAAIQDHTADILNDRKRRAEEAYVQQFGPKKRKSNAAQNMPLDDLALEKKTPSATESRPISRRESKTPTRTRRVNRSSTVEAPVDFDVLSSHSDIDHHKRPSRRELEKENQQLRALLRQQHQEPVSDSTHSQPKPTSTQSRQPPESECVSETTPGKALANQAPKKSQGRNLPPVPQIPERVALQNLSNARNQSQVKAKSANSNTSTNTNSNNNGSNGSDAPKELTAMSMATIGLPRPVSIILEVDEEGENKSPSPQCVKRLEPSEVEKRKLQEQMAMQIKGFKREQWEWPEDVF